MSGRRLALIVIGISISFNSFANNHSSEYEAYLVNEQAPFQGNLIAPPNVSTQEAKLGHRNPAPSRPGSRFDEIDDYKFGEERRNHRHDYGDRDCHSASSKIRNATRSLNNLAFSGQVRFSSWQAQNYYQISMSNLQEAARALSYGYQGQHRAKYILNNYIPYLRSLAKQGHLQFWDGYGRDTFRQSMRQLREANRMLEGFRRHHGHHRRLALY